MGTKKEQFYKVFGVTNLKENTGEEYFDNGMLVCDRYGLSESSFYYNSSKKDFFIIGDFYLVRKITIIKK